jgi:hypothetical protein
MKRTIIAVIVLIVVGVGFYWGYQKATESNYIAPQVQVPEISTTTANSSTQSSTLNENIASQNSKEIDLIDRSLIVELGVGVGDLKFGMTRAELEKVMGKPDRAQGMALEYLDKGMAILGSRTSAVSVVLFGDMNNAKSPLVQACKYRTSKGIGMNSTLNEIKEAYGDPSSIEPLGKGQVLSYKAIGARFTLIDGKVIHMQFKSL